MTCGQRIKEARKAAGLTQKELGARMGVTYQTVAQWENDFRNPKPATVQRLADALGVPTWRLSGVMSLDDFQDSLKSATIDCDTAADRERALKKLASIADFISDTTFGLMIAGAMYGDYDVKGYTEMLSLQNDLIDAFRMLNPDGQEIAVERVEELTEIPKYRREDPAPADGSQDD